MAKRRASAYARCVGAYLRGKHGGDPAGRMKAAAAKCRSRSRTTRRRRRR